MAGSTRYMPPKDGQKACPPDALDPTVPSRPPSPAHPRDAGIMWAMPYAYLGPEGTFSEAALRTADSGAEPLSCPTIQAALAAVREGAAERAVVPIESSVEGVVTATLDDLATGNDLVIVAELQIPIAFALLARPGTGLGDIKRIGGHPQAMPQCRGWLAANLPDSEWVPLASNAEAARQAADGHVDAALAGAFAADRYGLQVIAPDVHDRANAVTRFVVVSPPTATARAHRGGPDVTGRVPGRGSPGRAARDPHRIRGARHQPDHDPVPADWRPARPVLLLHRLRGACR